MKKIKFFLHNILFRNRKITVGDYDYKVKILTTGEMYITQTYTVEAFRRIMKSDKPLVIKSGIIW